MGSTVRLRPSLSFNRDVRRKESLSNNYTGCLVRDEFCKCFPPVLFVFLSVCLSVSLTRRFPFSFQEPANKPPLALLMSASLKACSNENVGHIESARTGEEEDDKIVPAFAKFVRNCDHCVKQENT